MAKKKQVSIDLNIDVNMFHGNYYQEIFSMLEKNPKRKQVGPYMVVYRNAGPMETGIIEQIFEAMSKKDFSSQALKTCYHEYEGEDGYIGTDGVYVQYGN